MKNMVVMGMLIVLLLVVGIGSAFAEKPVTYQLEPFNLGAPFSAESGYKSTWGSFSWNMYDSYGVDVKKDLVGFLKESSFQPTYYMSPVGKTRLVVYRMTGRWMSVHDTKLVLLR